MTPARNSFAFRLALVFLGLSMLSLFFVAADPVPPHLTVEMAATKPSIAQLFYDVGNGFREEDSSVVRVSGSGLAAFEKLSFKLPAKTVLRLRLDPSTGDGQTLIRSLIVRKRNVWFTVIPLARIQGANQIESASMLNGGLKITPAAGATDPFLYVNLERALRLGSFFTRPNLVRAGVIHLCLAGLYGMLFALRRHVLAMVHRFKAMNNRFDALAARLAHVRYLRLDAFALRVYFSLVALFLVASIFRLNGSSSQVLAQVYGNGPIVMPLLGEAQEARSDEWSYVTPDILNQYYRADRFETYDSGLGGHNVSLTGNLPVKDLSTFFRPQFWGFFFLPLEYAFALYWQTKALVLSAGVFTFLLWICGSSRWALVGALWYFFSPFTQWTFSWPSALPDMTGSVCLATVCFCYLTIGRSKGWLTVAACGFVLFSVNFTMCAYPPHMIPLAWVATLVTVAWCCGHWRDIIRTDGLGRRATAAACSFGALLVVGLHMLRELHPAIVAIGNTIYPGHRIVPGGSLPLWEMGFQLAPWTAESRTFPTVMGNICEGSGFLWLAPVTLLQARRIKATAFERNALLALWTCFAMLFYWCAFPAASWLGNFTLLNRCMGPRCVPALGLANVALTIMFVARARAKASKFSSALVTGLYFAAVGAVAFLAIRYANQHLGHYLSRLAVLYACLLLAGISALLLTGRNKLAAFVLLAPHIILSGAVNPIQAGLPVFTHSRLQNFMQQRRELLTGRWIVFSDTPVRSGFVAASGATVYTGLHQIPDVDHFHLLISRGLDAKVFNNLGYVCAHPIAQDRPMRMYQAAPLVLRWEVTPTDPILKSLGVRYLAFDQKPEPGISAGLTPLANEPMDNLWLYRIDGA